MNRKIEKQLDQLDGDLTALFEELKVYSESQLNRSPEKGGWTIIQVMHHLMLAEGYSSQYVQKKLSFSPELKTAGLPSYFRRVLASTLLKSPLKHKAPEAVGEEHLPEHATFWDTAKQWRQQRKELREYLASLPADHFKKSLYKHPLVGKMSLGGMLKFYDSHFKRHRKQIRKITKHYYV